jgi:excisionase family DNA binding protein
MPAHEYLTVKELAELLRLKERKIYDLAASGAVPCSKATGKLLFPRHEVLAWIEAATSGLVPGQGAPRRPRPAIVLGSHDPLLDWAIRSSRCGLATFYDGSLDGLARFAKGEGTLTGLHVHDAVTGTWNVPVVAEGMAGAHAVLVSFAKRRRGLVFRADTPVLGKLSDLAGSRIVPRQVESGTDTLFRELSARAGLSLSDCEFSELARTEDAAVEAVRRGDADVAFGLEAVAASYGLEFAFIVEEHFALLIDRKAWFEKPVQTLMSFCQTQQFADRAKALGGYDISGLGEVVWNAA